MDTLHLISNPKALADCLRVAGPKDTLVLLEDGIYAIAQLKKAAQANPSQRFWTIADDVATRGVPAQASDIDYPKLVELCTEHQPIATWC